MDIEIRQARTVLAQVFADLAGQNLTKGVIKLDVEGYEPSVLRGIAYALPAGVSAMIIFESWNANFDMTGVIKSFNGRAVAHKLVRQTPWQQHWPAMAKALALLVNPRITTRVIRDAGNDWTGDIILAVSATAP